MPIRVIVIEDHPLMLDAVVNVLHSHPGIQVVGKSNRGSELMRLARELKPDVVVLDLGMSNEKFEPVSAVRSVLDAYPNLRILVLTGDDDDVMARSIVKAGALGFVLKGDDLSRTLPQGVERVYAGKRFYSADIIDKILSVQRDEEVVLNEQEIAVMRLVAQGLSNVSVAEAMQISEKRVRTLLSSIYAKFDLHDNEEINVRIAAINKARELGLVT